MDTLNLTPEKINEIKSATDIVEVIGEQVVLKKNGADYFGLCLFHTEKTPSFSVSPGKQMFYCFGCAAGGDVIEFLIKTGMSFTDAIKSLAGRAGIALPAGKMFKSSNNYHTPRPPIKKNDPMKMQPEGRILPDIPEGVIDINLWREKATRLVEWAHELLLENDNVRRWLLKRGIKKKSIIKFKLGWNPGREGKDLWRPRESWGLETIFKKNRQKKKLWIPIGLIIPKIDGSTVERIRIRRPQDKPKYFVIPGSTMTTLSLRADSRAVVIVESELDAILLDQEAEDLAGVVALGSSSSRPDRKTVSELEKAAVILNALDYDHAGLKASKWWQETFPQVIRWPVPVGGDPREAFKAGVDLEKWIIAGLPLEWEIGQSLLGSITKRGATLNERIQIQNDGEKSQPSCPIKKDRAIYGLSESPPLKQCLDVPAKVHKLADLLKKHPVSIYVSPERVYVREAPAWTRQNWEISKELSNLIFMTPEVFDYLCGHPDRVIDGRNII